MNLLSTFARQKYRFDIGQGFMSVVNFSFVVLAASDKITSITNLPAKIIVPIVVPIAIISVWLIGMLFDKARFMQAYHHEMNIRNDMLHMMWETEAKHIGFVLDLVIRFGPICVLLLMYALFMAIGWNNIKLHSLKFVLRFILLFVPICVLMQLGTTYSLIGSYPHKLVEIEYILCGVLAFVITTITHK